MKLYIAAATATIILSVDGRRLGQAKIHGIGYAPSLKEVYNPKDMQWDDVMTMSGQALGGQVWWGDGENDRGDLGTIEKLGANAIRLYGLTTTAGGTENDYMVDHSTFLKTAKAHNLKLFPGTSDYYLTQSGSGNCQSSPSKCYDLLFSNYDNLFKKTGFKNGNGWDTSVERYALANELDAKFKGWKNIQYVALASLDALLVAEKQNGITGHKPKINLPFTTATTNAYGTDSYCFTQGKIGSDSNAVCSVAQMCDFYFSILDPSLVGYTPTSTLAELKDALENRIEFGFNSFQEASQVKQMIIEPFNNVPELKGKTLIATEYNIQNGSVDVVQSNVETLLGFAEIEGVYFFQFETAYWKGGSEEYFGMFTDGTKEVGTCQWPNCYQKSSGSWQPVYCLETTNKNGYEMGSAISKVYKGSSPDSTWKGFCA